MFDVSYGALTRWYVDVARWEIRKVLVVSTNREATLYRDVTNPAIMYHDYELDDDEYYAVRALTQAIKANRVFTEEREKILTERYHAILDERGWKE